MKKYDIQQSWQVPEMAKGKSECVLSLLVTSDREQSVHKESPKYTTSPNVDNQPARISPKTNPKSTKNTGNTHILNCSISNNNKNKTSDLRNEPSKLMSRNNSKPHGHPRRCSGDLVNLVRFIYRALLNSLLQQR